MANLTLEQFLSISKGDVQVCVKEPGKCADYWTVLKNGKSNMHTDRDLDRQVYEIKTINDCLEVYVW